ncbi:MAG: CdaR family protein [Candidatus Cloacimonadota bacterium]|nr:CdaR family protein [Candidatus Cloacimonadota bacterium]
MKKNLWIKVLVLIIAIFLWIQQVLIRTQTEEILFPVYLENIPTNLVPVHDEVPKVPVAVTGRGLDIVLLKYSDYYFRIDASQFKKGENEVEVSEEQLFFPENRDLTVRKLNLDEKLTILMDEITTASKRILLQYQSGKDEEYFIKNKLSLEKKEVQIRGPSRIVEEIAFVETEKISKNILEDGSLKVNLIKPSPKIELLDSQINITITQSKIITKTISLIPVEYPQDIEVTIIPQKVSAMISGPEEQVSELNNTNVVARLDKEEVIENTYVSVYFDLPTGIKLLDYTPQYIQVIKKND